MLEIHAHVFVFNFHHLETNDLETKIKFEKFTTMMTTSKWWQTNLDKKCLHCCAFCKKESETIEHVFLFCKDVLLLWNTLSQHIFITTDIRVCFDINNVMLGDLPLSKHNKVVNFIILWTKQFIFLCLMQKKYQYLKLSYAILELDTK